MTYKRKDLPPDAEQWEAELKAKDRASKRIAEEIAKRAGLEVSEMIVWQVQRTMAGALSQRRKRIIDLEVIEWSARNFGFFSSSESKAIAKVIVNSNLLDVSC